MRVAVGDTATGDQAARRDQFVDDGGVGLALFALVVQHAQSGKEWHMGQEFAVFAHVVGHPVDPVAFDEAFVIVRAVAGGRVNEAGARVIGDMIAVDHWHIVIPKAVSVGQARKGVGQGQAGQFIARHVAQAGPHVGVKAGFAQHLSGQGVGQKVAIANRAPAFIRRAGDFVKAIGDLGVIGDGLIRGDRPRCRCPDHGLGVRKVT